MNYTDLEKEIVDRIIAVMQTNNVTEIEVSSIPDTDDDLKKPVRAKGRVWVEVAGDVKDEDPSSTAHIRQLETVNINVHIHSKFRHSPSENELGVFEIEEMVRKYLVGWRPTHFNRIYKTGFKFSQRLETSSAWEYTLSLAATTLIVEDTDAANDPLISQITLNSNDGATVQVPPQS
jgi:hypothetical protein